MRRDTAQINQIAKVVRDTLRSDFDDVKILDVKVSNDNETDDEILRIEVIFKGTLKDINTRRLSGVVRHVRPKLTDIGEKAFPLFSFISEGDVGTRRFEPA